MIAPQRGVNFERVLTRDGGTKALSTGNLTKLTFLDLKYNYIGDEGANALLTGNLINLAFLDLQVNLIGDEGKEAFANKRISLEVNIDSQRAAHPMDLTEFMAF